MNPATRNAIRGAAAEGARTMFAKRDALSRKRQKITTRLGPLTYGLVVLGITALIAAATRNPPVGAVVLTSALVLVASLTRHGWSNRHDLPARRPDQWFTSWINTWITFTREHYLRVSFWLAAAAWTAHAVLYGPLTGEWGWGWWVLVIAGTAARWRTPTETTSRLDIHADEIGLPGARLVKPKRTEHGWEAVLHLAPGYTYDHAIKRRAQLEAALGMRRGSLHIEPTPANRADQALLRAVTRDPHAQIHSWQGPSLRKPHDPLTLGPYADGTSCTVALFDGEHGARNVLIGGTRGSGKSVLMNRIILEYGYLPEVALWLVDLKGGQELGVYAHAADRIATTADEAHQLVHEAQTLTSERGSTAHPGSRVIQPSLIQPLVLLVVDEFAELATSRQALQAISSVARRGRSKAVAMVLATQNPTREATGTTQIRSECSTRVCFRMHEPNAARVILHQLDADPTTIPANRPGTCFVERGADTDRNIPARCLNVTEPQIEQHSAGLTRTRVHAEATEDPTLPLDEDEPELEPAGETSDGSAKAFQHYLDLLSDEATFSPADVMYKLGMSRATAKRRVREARRDGRITEVDFGVYQRQGAEDDD